MRQPISERELARRAKVKQATFVAAMVGRRPPPLERIIALAECMGCTPAQRDELVDIALRGAGLEGIAELLTSTRAEVGDLMERLEAIERVVGRRVAEPRAKHDR